MLIVQDFVVDILLLFIHMSCKPAKIFAPMFGVFSSLYVFYIMCVQTSHFPLTILLLPYFGPVQSKIDHILSSTVQWTLTC